MSKIDIKLIENIATIIRDNVKGICRTNEPMSNHTSFKVGGPAAIYAYPEDENALKSLVQICQTHTIKTLLIGYGNNLLVSDDGFNGCVIDLTKTFRSIDVDDTHVSASSGVWLSDVVDIAAVEGLSGIEKLAGIPGAVGAGLSMNCGAFGSYISDFLVDVKVMDSQGGTKSLLRAEIEFGYRESPGLHGLIVLKAGFKLNHEKPEIVRIFVDETIAERHRRNVMILPSAGSVFRNPEGNYAAKLLEGVSAKGMRVGGVEVSKAHANFIVNSNNGKASDIMELIQKLKDLVFTKYKVELKLELRTVGFDDFKA
ncbi:UDP-N-acetylmuramate dehydrogenase [bacterium]|nr:UDP-N-acetylmuramate dehydrogenase [bacterium]